jgi:hypothetical protein
MTSKIDKLESENMDSVMLSLCKITKSYEWLVVGILIMELAIAVNIYMFTFTLYLHDPNCESELAKIHF